MLKEETVESAIKGIESLKEVFVKFQELSNFWCEIRGMAKPKKINHILYDKKGDYFYSKCEMTDENSIQLRFSVMVMLGHESKWKKTITDAYIIEICEKAGVLNPIQPVYYLIGEDNPTDIKLTFNADSDEEAVDIVNTWIVMNSEEENGYYYGLFLRLGAVPGDEDPLVDNIEVACN